MLIGSGAGLGNAPAAGQSKGSVYRVDCRSGSDRDPGTTVARAWRTLERASRADLRPGDSLLLRRGCRWQETLRAPWTGTAAAPITIGAYGEGALPIIENQPDTQVAVFGSWLLFTDLHVQAAATTFDPGCHGQASGRQHGFRVEAGAKNNTFLHVRVTDLYIGIRLELGADHNRILDSTFIDNNVKSDDFLSDGGADAIAVEGDDNEVAWNRIFGSDTCSHFFLGRDGSAIEIFGGRHNIIHHNISVDNHNFIELGNPRTQDTLIVYNSHRSSQEVATWLVVHGVGSRYGPVRGTRAYHNTAVLDGARSEGMLCARAIDAGTLDMRANIVWSEGSPSTCKETFREGDNLFWRSDGEPEVGFRLSPSSRLADPRLINALGGDFGLTSNSPAVDAASPLDLEGYGDRDLAGVTVPQGVEADIGAFELAQPTAGPSSSSPPAGSSRPPASTLTPRPSTIPTTQPPTGGAGAFDALILVGAVVVGGLGISAIVVGRRRPR